MHATIFGAYLALVDPHANCMHAKKANFRLLRIGYIRRFFLGLKFWSVFQKNKRVGESKRGVLRNELPKKLARSEFPYFTCYSPILPGHEIENSSITKVSKR